MSLTRFHRSRFRVPLNSVWAAAGTLLILHAAFIWQARTPAVLLAGDDAGYSLLARSLRSFRYVEIWQIGQPPHRDFPPVYPAVLSVWGSLHGDNHDLLLLLNVAFSVGALLLLFIVLKRLWSPTVAVLSLMALFANPHLVEQTGVLRAETLYMALSLGALVLAVAPSPSGRTRLVAGFTAILAALTRTAGVALLVALGLNWIQARRFRAAGAFAIAAGVLAGSWLYHSLGAADFEAGSYRAELMLKTQPETGGLFSAAELRNRMLNAARYVGFVIPSTMSLPSVAGTRVDSLVHGVVLAVFGITGLLLLYRCWRPAAYYLPCYGAVLLIWPWVSSRLVVPFVILIVPAIIVGCEEIMKRVSLRLKVPSMMMLAGTLAVIGLFGTVRLSSLAAQCRRGSLPPDASCLNSDQADYFQALQFAKEQLPPDAVLLTTKPRPVHFYTDLLTVDRDETLDALSQRDLAAVRTLADAGISHVLLGHANPVELRLFAHIVPRCRQISPLKRFGKRTYLFEVSEPPSEGELAGCRALEDYRQASTDPATGRFLRDFDRPWPPPAR
jgi:hypothetical protein